ncbi:DUF2975 domain-containing protein [Corynebacterium efficiens]|uniref:DUF2975 domain-containing protein n=1 Tax=Corynebacterium efficiens (strain DSM 44549 / YS-314 / AJ 12310 / JCM 11189 / NBRC 100395) TaxID=196164 RepID=Q8FPU7_COREF|nr:DUF2975 domain-containing protein [Corynebacterium efficiens]BAC18201.1 conserved hypothetical protein [Corynebacterium efficiens YS-314]
MNPRILSALRIIFGIGFLGALAVQGLMITQLVIDTLEHGTLSRTPLVILVLLFVTGFGLVQFIIVCLFRLLAMVEHDEIFNRRAITWVDRITVAIAAAAVLLLPFGYILAELDDAPGLVIVAMVVSLLVLGVALLVYVTRTLLARAIGFSTELDGVI